LDGALHRSLAAAQSPISHQLVKPVVKVAQHAPYEFPAGHFVVDAREINEPLTNMLQ